MGSSGMVLRKTKELELKKTKKRVISIIKSLGYAYDICNEDLDVEGYCTISIGNNLNFDRGFVMWLYGKPDLADQDNFKWIDSDLNQVINIEDISGRIDMILKFLHKYFKYYPNDYFNNELDWFYTKEDIDRIYNGSDWEYWCYKKPPGKEEKF